MTFPFYSYPGFFLFIIFLFYPMVIYLFPSILIRFVFIGSSKQINYLKDPENFRFTERNFRNFRIKNSKLNYELGAWQIICKDDETPGYGPLTQREFERIFANMRPIVLYFHGNKDSRGIEYRVNFYHLLRKNGFHVLTVDYRGYGDSDGALHTENDVLEDAYITFVYLMKIAPNSSVFVWGHSLGTGVSSLFVNKLASLRLTFNVMALFLEAPFTSIPDFMTYTPYLALWRIMFYFNLVFQESAVYQKLIFNNSNNLITFFAPLLIMHAEDDEVINFKMGQQLYSSLILIKKDVYMKLFSYQLNLGHSGITKYFNLPKLIIDFANAAQAQNNTGQTMSFNTDGY